MHAYLLLDSLRHLKCVRPLPGKLENETKIQIFAQLEDEVISHVQPANHGTTSCVHQTLLSGMVRAHLR